MEADLRNLRGRKRDDIIWPQARHSHTSPPSETLDANLVPKWGIGAGVVHPQTPHPFWLGFPAGAATHSIPCRLHIWRSL